MANLKQLAILKQGVRAWNTWQNDNFDIISDLSDADLSGAKLAGIRLFRANLAGTNLFGADLSGANLAGTNLSLANLAGANLSGANLFSANFSGADLSGTKLSRTESSGAKFSSANLSGATLSGANFSDANFSDADLSRSDLSNVNLSGATLSRADLTGANLSGAKFSNSNLFSADLSNVTHSRANFSNANLSGAKFSGSDLSGSDFSDAGLADTIFSDANLSGANLSRANLLRANFSFARLFDASLSGAYISMSKLSSANLSGADLSGADVSGSDFSDANLSGVNLSGANFTFVCLRKTLFSNRAVLNTLAHELFPDQLAGCIFLDEESARRTKDGTSFEGLPSLCLHFDAPVWTPLDASVALANVQLAINRIQYLLATEETSPEILERSLAGPCFPADFNQAIRLAELHTGSLDAHLSFIKDVLSPQTVKVLVVAGLLVYGAEYVCEKYSVMQKNAAETFKCRAEGKKAEAEAEKTRVETEILRAKAAKEAVSDKQSDRPDMLLPLMTHDGISKMPLDVIEKHIKVPSAFTPVSETVREAPEKYLSLAVQPLYSFISVIKDQGHEVWCRIYNAKEWADKFGVDLAEAEAAGLISDKPDEPFGDKHK